MPEQPLFQNARPAQVLVATGDEIAYSVLKQQLEGAGYALTRKETISEVSELVEHTPFAVVITEDHLPDGSGLDLLRKLHEYRPGIIRLIFRGKTPVRMLAEEAKAGTIFRFLSKPWFHSDLLVTLQQALHLAKLTAENKSLHDENIQLNLSLSGTGKLPPVKQLPNPDWNSASTPSSPSDGSQSTDVLPLENQPAGADLAMRAFGRMLETFHPNLGNVAARTVALCRTLSEVLALPPDDAGSLIWAGALHDVGLVLVDRELVRRWLRGPEKCDEKDLELIQRHPTEAQRILKNFNFLDQASEIIHSHHECWDGSGYPDGLKEDMIPWLSRLLSVAIEYSSKHGPGIQVMAQIEEEAGVRFDPDAINALAKAAYRTVMPRGEREILLIELKSGMVLARDIFNANGFLLLPKGSVITDASVSKLWSVNRIAPIDPFLLVYT